jgi:hypothetical protein
MFKQSAHYADNKIVSYFAWNMEILWLSPQRIGSNDWHTVPQAQHVSFQGRKIAIYRPFASCSRSINVPVAFNSSGFLSR